MSQVSSVLMSKYPCERHTGEKRAILKKKEREGNSLKHRNRVATRSLRDKIQSGPQIL